MRADDVFEGAALILRTGFNTLINPASPCEISFQRTFWRISSGKIFQHIDFEIAEVEVNTDRTPPASGGFTVPE